MLSKIMDTPLDVRFAEKQKGDMRHTFASIESAKKDLGYDPSFSLLEGLTTEYSWLKELFQQGRSYRMDE